MLKPSIKDLQQQRKEIRVVETACAILGMGPSAVRDLGTTAIPESELLRMIRGLGKSIDAACLKWEDFFSQLAGVQSMALVREGMVIKPSSEFGDDAPDSLSLLPLGALTGRDPNPREDQKPQSRHCTTAVAAVGVVCRQLAVAENKAAVLSVWSHFDNRDQVWVECARVLAVAEREIALIEGNPKESREQDALAMLARHPDWTTTRIAEELGVNRTSLYRMKTFIAARAVQRQSGAARLATAAHRGDIR
jgi:hypothetical protein